MTDLETWQQGARMIGSLYDRLSAETRRRLDTLLDGYRRRKEEMLTLTLAAGSAGICRTCGGQCCLNGKYRISGLDVLALLGGQEPLVVPDFAGKPFCPYGDAAGCAMAPPFRPLDCVLFICEPLERVLDETAAARLALLERELRALVKEAEGLLETALGRPLMLMAERSTDGH